MDSIQLKAKELQSKMYLTQSQTHRLRLTGLTKAVNSPQQKLVLPQRTNHPMIPAVGLIYRLSSSNSFKIRFFNEGDKVAVH